MTTAGIDFGSTLTKAYWRTEGRDRFATVSGDSMRDVLEEMRADGVRTLRLTGIGHGTSVADRAYAESRFRLVLAPEGAVDDEIRLQAVGARALMARGAGAPRKMLVAAVGTGVSYTFVRRHKGVRHDLGSCHGGGTMMGLARRLLGVRDFQELEASASLGTPADLLVKDQLPATAGTPIGELVIAHFCKEGAKPPDIAASIFSFAACSIAKDLAVLRSIPFSPKDIVVVGTVAASPLFRAYLGRWAPMLKKARLHFPENGAHAAAVGARADIST